MSLGRNEKGQNTHDELYMERDGKDEMKRTKSMGATTDPDATVPLLNESSLTPL